MNRKLKFILIGLVVLLAAGAGIVKKKQQLAQMKPSQPQPQAVETATAVNGTVVVHERHLASIEASVKADLAPRITGTILAIHRREGDAVRRGELLALLDDRELGDRAQAVEAEVRAMEQRIAGARSNYETQRGIFGRDEALFKAGAISREALDRSRSALDSARAALDAYQASREGLQRSSSASRHQTAYARLTAPFDGVVSKRWAEPGDLALPGKPVLSIEQKGAVKLLVQVPQETIAHTRVGTPARLVGTDNQVIEAKVTRVYPTVGKNLLGTVEIGLLKSPFNLPSGGSIGVELQARAVTGVVVPDGALLRDSQGAIVFQIRDGVVQPVKVELLAGNGKQAVVAGIAAGTVVAVGQENRLRTLTAGSRVTAPGGKLP